MFATMALYDAKERKKISENFYFDMTPENMKTMLRKHIPCQDVSTLSRSCIFSVTYPSEDLFLVVKLEKVLQQGDISEAAEPYINPRDDKVRESSSACSYSTQCAVYCGFTKFFLIVRLVSPNCLYMYVTVMKARERARQNATHYCEKLGRYRMPFAWTAVYLKNVVCGPQMPPSDSSGGGGGASQSSGSMGMA